MDIPAVSLCSGIGGLDTGLERAIKGVRVVCHVEREKFSVVCLIKNRPDVPIHCDVRTFDGKPFRGRVLCVTGGYPCQPFSCAGKRAGESDPRHLWPEFKRIVSEIEPVFCVFENVPGHVSKGFDTVSRDLFEMGYEVEAGEFAAAETGAPHLRKRLFILAYREGELWQRIVREGAGCG